MNKIKILLVAAILLITFTPPTTTHAALFTNAAACNASPPINFKVTKFGRTDREVGQYGTHWKTNVEVGHDRITWTPAPETNNACATHRFFGIYVNGVFVCYQRTAMFDTNLSTKVPLRHNTYAVTTVFLTDNAKTVLLEGTQTGLLSTQ